MRTSSGVGQTLRNAAVSRATSLARSDTFDRPLTYAQIVSAGTEGRRVPATDQAISAVALGRLANPFAHVWHTKAEESGAFLCVPMRLIGPSEVPIGAYTDA